MPKNLPIRCSVCGRRKSESLHISRRGKCDVCAIALMQASMLAQGLAVERAKESVREWAKTRGDDTPPVGVGGTPASKLAEP